MIVLNDKKTLKEQKINEWKHGKLPDESDISEYRSKNYEIFKYKLNPLAFGTVDLILTGYTANSLFAQKGTEERGFIFGLNDKYNLVKKYTRDILGLNPKWFLNRQKELYVKQLIKTIKTNYKIA